MKRIMFAVLIAFSVFIPAQLVVAALTEAETKELQDIEKALKALEDGKTQVTLASGKVITVHRRKTKYDEVTKKRLEERKAELEAKKD